MPYVGLHHGVFGTVCFVGRNVSNPPLLGPTWGESLSSVPRPTVKTKKETDETASEVKTTESWIQFGHAVKC